MLFQLLLRPFAASSFSVTGPVLVSSSVGKGSDDDVDAVCTLDCFPGDTLVTTPRGFVAIQSLRPGDSVVTSTGSAKVRAVLRSQAAALVAISALGLAPIRVSRGHPIWTLRGWVPASELRSGDRLLLRSGRTATVEGIRALRFAVPMPVFNLELDGGSSFVVGPQGVEVQAARPRARRRSSVARPVVRLRRVI